MAALTSANTGRDSAHHSPRSVPPLRTTRWLSRALQAGIGQWKWVPGARLALHTQVRSRPFSNSVAIET